MTLTEARRTAFDIKAKAITLKNRDDNMDRLHEAFHKLHNSKAVVHKRAADRSLAKVIWNFVGEVA